jgi:hypothetical protein
MKKLLSLLLLLAAGPAFADPISAVASIATMSSAAGGMAAIGTTIASGMAGMTLASGLSFVGGAIGLVGSITGNKKLRNLGGVLAIGGSLTSLFKDGVGGAAGDAAKSAGKDALSQTATTPVEQVTQEMTAEQGKAAAQEKGFGTDDLGIAQPTKPSLVQEAAKTNESVQGPGKDTSLIGQLSEGLKKHKELAKIGAGLVSGAASGYMQREAGKDQEAALNRQRARFSQSVVGVDSMGQFINPNADVTNVNPRDPMRYVPRRGLVQRPQQNGG